MTTCPRGHENPDHYRYCGECGAPVIGEDSGSPATPSQPGGDATVPQIQTTPPFMRQPAPQAHSYADVQNPPTPGVNPGAASAAWGVSPQVFANRHSGAFGGPPRRGWYRLSQGGQLGVAAAVVFAVLGVVVAIAISLSPGSKNAGDQATPSAPAPSSSDDWERAVCRPGTFFQGTHSTLGGSILHNATGSAHCIGQSYVEILIGQYSSDFALENDVAPMKGCSYATITANSGETWVFIGYLAQGERSASALSPLTQFGFEMQTVPLSR